MFSQVSINGLINFVYYFTSQEFDEFHFTDEIVWTTKKVCEFILVEQANAYNNV